jgi:hypothetical protein
VLSQAHHHGTGHLQVMGAQAAHWPAAQRPLVTSHGMKHGGLDSQGTSWPRLVTANEPHNEEDFTSDDEQDDENDDASIIPFITSESLDRYRKDGPFGKLHNIGVHLRQSSQLQQAFRDSQQPCNTLFAWVHNVATRWSSDYAMATRALQLRGPFIRFFADIESQGIAAAIRWPGFWPTSLNLGNGV